LQNIFAVTMSQTRLVDLARLNIQSSIARQVDFYSFIRNFANKITRKSLVEELNNVCFSNFLLD